MVNPHKVPEPAGKEKAMQSIEQTSFGAEELAELTLKDARLTKRAKRILTDMSANPSGSIPQFSGSVAASKAAYSFFESEAVEAQALITAERQATLQRMTPGQVVLYVQDTTEINLSHFPSIEGVGSLAGTNQSGFLAHTTLAVAENGTPLGVIAQAHWVRPASDASQSKRTKQIERPIEAKESYKWLKGLLSSTASLPPANPILFVSDAESDVSEYFQLPRPANVDLLVRAAQNRSLLDSELLLWQTLRKTPVAGVIEVEVEAKEQQPKRLAHCHVHFRQVTLRPSNSNRSRHSPRRQPVKLWAVLVIEQPTSETVEPILWLLLTTRPLTTFAQACQLITFYTYRWLIERFHYVLKSGCGIEQRRLGSVASLIRFLALANCVAWRLLWLTYLARTQPDSPCTLALQDDEWMTLYSLTHAAPLPPATPPSLRTAIRWLAKLGGFLGRKGDGEPGVQVLWRGWTALMPALRLWRLFHPPLPASP
jgi:Transposase Tn5 dimerisation domain/Transposase DNA-binding